MYCYILQIVYGSKTILPHTSYHNKYIIPMLYKIFHGFADNPLHAVPQALAVASELAVSLRRWSNIDNWHAECDYRSDWVAGWCYKEVME